MGQRKVVQGNSVGLDGAGRPLNKRTVLCAWNHLGLERHWSIFLVHISSMTDAW